MSLRSRVFERLSARTPTGVLRLGVECEWSIWTWGGGFGVDRRAIEDFQRVKRTKFYWCFQPVFCHTYAKKARGWAPAPENSGFACRRFVLFLGLTGSGV